MNDVDIWTIFEKKYQKLVFLIKFQSLLRQATTRVGCRSSIHLHVAHAFFIKEKITPALGE
jgi:hypothetical protein